MNVMLESRGNNTFMLFTTKRGKIDRIYGPVFPSEVEMTRLKLSPEAPEKVKMVEENTFSCVYPEQYKQHVIDYWTEKAFTYFALVTEWAGATFYVAKSKGFYNDWFNIYETLQEDERVLQINFRVNCNRFHRARLIVDLTEELHGLKLVEGAPFLKGSDNALYTGGKAISRDLAENYLRHYNTN